MSSITSTTERFRIKLPDKRVALSKLPDRDEVMSAWTAPVHYELSLVIGQPVDPHPVLDLDGLRGRTYAREMESDRRVRAEFLNAYLRLGLEGWANDYVTHPEDWLRARRAHKSRQLCRSYGRISQEGLPARQ